MTESLTQSRVEILIQEARKTGDYQPFVKEIPYANLIGLELQALGDDLLYKLPRNPDNIGNPLLPAIHGGVIGGFMELAASLELLLRSDPIVMPKMVDFSLDYLRAGRHQDTYAECQVWRQGNRVANVSVTAWQRHRREPIATARAHYLMASEIRNHLPSE